MIHRAWELAADLAAEHELTLEDAINQAELVIQKSKSASRSRRRASLASIYSMS